MASTPTFRSWELTWTHYGPFVHEVAHALDPLASETDRNTQVTATAAAGFLDSDSIDPLTALLAELLRNRPTASRVTAAQVLVAHGIDADRASSITGLTKLRNTDDLRNGQRGNHSECQVPPMMLVPFESVRASAIALWEQQSTLVERNTAVDRNKTADRNKAPQIEGSTNANAVPMRDADRRLWLAAQREQEALAKAESQARERQSLEVANTRKRRQRNARICTLIAVVLSVAAGKSLGPRFLIRLRDRNAPKLLVVKDLPNRWVLTFATSHLPAKVINPTAVFQRFDSFDKRRTVLVTTRREDGRFSDPSLGAPQVDPTRLAATNMMFQAEAIASDSFPVHSLANRPVMMEWKQPLDRFVMNQSETVVHVEARGMPSSDVRDLGRSLTARPNLLQNGWSTPEGFTEQITTPPRAVLQGIQSSLIVKSTLDGNTRVLLQMSRATEPSIPTDDLREPPETLTLPSGRAVKFSREFAHNYWWNESGYEFYATVLRTDNEERNGGEAIQQTKSFYSFEPLPDRHLDGVLDLLDRVRFGDSDQWRSLTAGYQASLQRLPSLGAIQIGGHRIEVRTLPKSTDEKPGATRIPHALCAYSVCAPIYREWDGLARGADLLVDDHWWHFRQIAKYDKTIPEYFTSPSVDRFTTGEASVDRVYKWWGIDFGTKATAARNANETSLLLRPLPR